jgi:hypothetical protein
MSPKEIVKRRGPKTPAGKLAVSRNASKHGILSPRPVVAAFESEQDWQKHRQAIIESLAPEGGIEEALAERVALASWRLNRVTVYETECITQEQEHVLEDVRKDRERALRLASLDAREARDIIAGTMLEGLVDNLGNLSDLAIETLSPPEVALEGAENVRRYYEAVRVVHDGEDASLELSYQDASWLLEKVAYYAHDYATAQKEEDEQVLDELPSITDQAQQLEEELFERVGNRDVITVSELREHVAWAATQAGIRDDLAVDGTIAYTPLEGLLEKLHTIALRDLRSVEEQREKVERKLIEKRRARILPSEEQLQRIRCYEAHLSREMYRSLHELEALQTRRLGGSAPLGRVDVSN